MKEKTRSPFGFRKVLVPFVYGCENKTSLALARAIVDPKKVMVLGLLPMGSGESLSLAALPSRNLRAELRSLARGWGVRIRPQVLVSNQPWQDLVRVVQVERPSLLILEWPDHLEVFQVSLAQAARDLACQVALVRGPFRPSPQRVLVALRGGPSAELALRLGLSLVRHEHASLASLHMRTPESSAVSDAPYTGLRRILAQIPEVEQSDVEINSADVAGVLLERSQAVDLLVMGARVGSDAPNELAGPLAQTMLEESQAGVVVVRASQPVIKSLELRTAGQSAISVLVDKWFAENTYHASEFYDLPALLELKRRRGLSVSLALPALNEEKTVGTVIQTIKSALMDEVPLLDEMVLVDSNSTDCTRQIARDLGVPVYIHQQVLPHYGARHGKGEALWKSLYLARGDIILWIDTDIFNIHPRFVYGLLGPLLHNPQIQLVKGFYRRPLRVGDKIQAGGGGRVTELTARPLLNLFFPELSGIIQPLSGEYGGRRAALEQLPFFSGYGVEIGLLIDMLEKFGLSSIAQVDLQVRIHHNQTLEALSKMSFAIIQAVTRKLEHRFQHAMLEEVNQTMKLIRHEPGRFWLDVEEITEQERPPMIGLPEYLERQPR